MVKDITGYVISNTPVVTIDVRASVIQGATIKGKLCQFSASSVTVWADEWCLDSLTCLPAPEAPHPSASALAAQGKAKHVHLYTQQ